MNSSIIGRFVLGALLWIALAVPTKGIAVAQSATPMAAPAAALEVPLIDATGAAVGLATFSEDGDGVIVTIAMEGLTPGEHGWHLHEMGVCDPSGAEPFESAGGHWNPTEEMHGSPAAEPHHTGDFGNFVATADGLAIAEFTTIEFSLGEGPDSVFDADGTAIIIHAGQDDLISQPSGDSGPRFACGIVAAPMGAAAAGTPAAGGVAATPIA